MNIRVLYFAGLREALGTAGETVEAPASVATAGDLRAWLRERGGAWAEPRARRRLGRAACRGASGSGVGRPGDGRRRDAVAGRGRGGLLSAGDRRLTRAVDARNLCA